MASEFVWMVNPAVGDGQTVAGPVTRAAFDLIHAGKGWTEVPEPFVDPIQSPSPQHDAPAPTPAPPTPPAPPAAAGKDEPGPEPGDASKRS